MKSAVVVGLAVIVGACGGDDAGGYTVGGSVTGLWEGDVLELRLEHGDAFTVASITADGPFQFDAAVADGASFAVTVANGRRCDVTGGAGTIAGAAIDDIAVRCTAAVDVTLSAAVPFTFDPVATRADVDLSILTQRLDVTVIAPGMTIEVDGAAASSAQPVPVTVAPGEQTVTLDLTDGPRHRRYELVLHRGARMVEHGGHLPAGLAQVNPADLGQSLALSDDELFAGAPGYDADLADEGALRRFTRDGTAWSAADPWLFASAQDAYADFGNAVALDGELLVVGAYQERDDFLNQGAVYVFRRTVTGWMPVARLVAPHPSFDDHFGSSVAIDGDTIAVGAIGEDSGALGVGGDQEDESSTDSGAVYVFEPAAPDVWALASYVKASSRTSRFGIGVDLDGERLAVGAGLSGRAYVFERSGASWVQAAVIEPPAASQLSLFGLRVALSGDRLAVSDTNDSGVGPGINGDMTQVGRTRSGAVYVFRSTDAGWVSEAYIKAAFPTDYTELGGSLAFTGDVLAVGAGGDSSGSAGIDGNPADTSAQMSGAAYIFHRDGTTWSQDAYVKSTAPVSLAGFGRGVALSWTGLAIGAPREPGGGAAYVLR